MSFDKDYSVIKIISSFALGQHQMMKSNLIVKNRENEKVKYTMSTNTATKNNNSNIRQ